MSSTINATTTSGIQVTGDNSGSLALQTNNGTTAVTIDTSQNVGIGTSSPSLKLHVVGSNNANNSGIAGGSYGIRFENGVTYSLTGSAISGVDNTFNASFQPLTINGSQLGFATGGTERMRIDSSGNVGIGTNSPSYKLQVSGSIKEVQSSEAATVGNVQSTFASSFQRTSNDTVLNIGYATTPDAWFISASYGTTGAYKPIAFATSDTERMRIDSSGNLLLGATSQPTGTQNAIGFSPSVFSGGQNCSSSRNSTSNVQHITFANPNGQVGGINTSGSATSFNTSSDYRLKHDIAPMTGALAKVQALKPVTYKWNADNSDGEGFIAHELAQVVPQCVTGEKDAVDADGNPVYQGIDTSFLVATLTAAIQEMKQLVDAQAAEIAALKTKVGG